MVSSARRRSERVLVTQCDGGTTKRIFDDLIVEEPMTIRLDDVAVTTTMRTPGHDFELAVGFCFSEGLLGGHRVREIRYCATGSAVDTEFNVVSVDTGGAAETPIPRLGTTSSSCGWCGSEMIDQMCARLAPLSPVEEIPLDVLVGVAETVRRSQILFERTGSVHAAAVFDRDGIVDLVREDVGRHNAVDKVIGALHLADRLPATAHGLFVSGRASIEMVQKAWAAGFSTLLSVSAPTALAVDTARRAGLVLVGFQRGQRLNRYSPSAP